MKYYILHRFLQLVIVLVAASMFSFALTYACPGDPAEQYFKTHETIPSTEALEQKREELGLNDSFIVQYSNWALSIIKGDLGYSYSNNEKIIDIFMLKAPITLKLAFIASIFLIVISVVFGILSAIYKNKVIDYLIRGLSFIGISIPVFWLGLILIYLFVVKIHWFRITEQSSLLSYLLPAITLAIPLIGRFTRLIRAEILDELNENYVVGAKSRGLSYKRIIVVHVLPNSLIGIITILGMSIAHLLGGTVIVESIFSLFGIGSMVLEAIQYRDYPLIQTYVIFMTTIYICVSFIIDIVIHIIDPRVKASAKESGYV